MGYFVPVDDVKPGGDVVGAAANEVEAGSNWIWHTPIPDKHSTGCVQYPSVTENLAGGQLSRVTLGHTGLSSELSRVKNKPEARQESG